MTGPELLGGRYEVRGVLGRGGMAEIRDGWDTRLDRAVAIKLLHPGFDTQADTRSRFAVEARAAAALNHPNVVAVHDTGDHHGTPYIVMERLSGETLADRIARGPLPTSDVHRILDQILAALSAAHGAGILHRDIKPANILFGAFGEAKLTDFGIAKTAGAGVTMTGQIVGTMAYLSPQRLGGAIATPADDTYAVGVVGYESLTGRRPFDAEHPGVLARMIMDGQRLPLRSARPDAPASVLDLVERAMANDAAQRFSNAGEMRAALHGRVAPSGTKVMDAPLPPSMTMPAVPPRPPSRSRRWLAIGAVAAAVLLALMLVLFEAASGTGPTPASTTTSTTSTPPTTTTPPPTTSAVSTPSTFVDGPPRGRPDKPPKKPKRGDDEG